MVFGLLIFSKPFNNDNVEIFYPSTKNDKTIEEKICGPSQRWIQQNSLYCIERQYKGLLVDFAKISNTNTGAIPNTNTIFYVKLKWILFIKLKNKDWYLSHHPYMWYLYVIFLWDIKVFINCIYRYLLATLCIIYTNFG